MRLTQAIKVKKMGFPVICTSGRKRKDMPTYRLVFEIMGKEKLSED